jgi:hypothetical protein
MSRREYRVFCINDRAKLRKKQANGELSKFLQFCFPKSRQKQSPQAEACGHFAVETRHATSLQSFHHLTTSFL